MKLLRFTLVTDGPTDAVLVYPLRWLLLENGVRWAIQPTWADFRQLRAPPSSLEDKVHSALDLYPCELLLIHRDAERDPREKRVAEIRTAARRIATDFFAGLVYAAVVPVRMTEAWFLFDEAAIRSAAGNPNGCNPLSLPDVSKVEGLADPKQMLNDLLRQATDKPTRRLRHFRSAQAFHRVAELTQDFGPLRRATAFEQLESDLRAIIREAHWDE
jgi:hypothetical protein